jgi:hypothetical protein
MRHGKLLSTFYLFETSIQKDSKLAGLIDARGRGSITAHRFRHTVGTQLAERGATARGWAREVECHQCTVRRLEKLLADLGEPFEDDPHAPTAELLALHPNGDADDPPIDEGALT